MHATTTAPVTIELARYTTHPRDEAAFLASHDAAIAALRRAFPALESVAVVRLGATHEATTWLDVARWRDAAEARRAGMECMTIPAFAECARFITGMVAIEHGELAATR